MKVHPCHTHLLVCQLFHATDLVSWHQVACESHDGARVFKVIVKLDRQQPQEIGRT